VTPRPVAAELEAVLFRRSGRREGVDIRFRCPFPNRHSNGDANPSARYHTEKWVWCCDVCGASGGWRDLCELLGVSPPKAAEKARPVVVATYEYRNEVGQLLRRKLRWQPGFDGRTKSFTWEEPDGSGGWRKCTGNGNPRVLYHSDRLPVVRDAGQRVLVVEGEKDVDRAAGLGFVAVCNPEGAGRGKWKQAYSEQLRGLDVVVIADRDGPGRSHAAAVADSLQDHAASVRVLELPGEGVKDLSDWIEHQEATGTAAAGIAAALEDLLAAAPPAGSGLGSDNSPLNDPLAPLLESLEQLDDDPDLAHVEELLRVLGAEAASLDRLRLEVVRERAVRALSGKVQAPGRLVDAALKAGAGEAEDDHQGRPLTIEDPEPWPDEVSGADLLEALEAVFLRFLVLPDGAATALALWTLHTFAHDAAAVSPSLAVTSPEKRCGKTTVLTLLTALVLRALPASNITPAALFRAVEKYQPTLVIDEADTFLREREELRGILNSGHTRETAFVVRTVGDDHDPRAFSTWAPKAIALIGRLPSTLEDRSIPILMKRKAPGETVDRLRLDRIAGELADLRRQAARWARDRTDRLRRADPDVPVGLHDRAADNWRPLLAIADDAGGAWPAKARTAAAILSGADDGDASARVQLLSDIHSALTDAPDARLFTSDLLDLLVADESRPWGEWRHGKPLTAIGLGRLLKPFGISPRKVRIGEETRQGYRAEDLAEAFERYIPAPPTPVNPEHPEQANGDGLFAGSPSRNTTRPVPACESPDSSMATGVVPGVPARNRESGHVGGADDVEVFEL
jgi:hypothetical protein